MSHSDREAVAYPTDIPGLYDVVMADGTVVADMTIGQLRTMAFHGYPIRRATEAESG